VPVFLTRLKISGSFDSRAIAAAAPSASNVFFKQAQLRLPLSDVRAVRGLSAQGFGGALRFRPAEPGAYSAVEADVDLSVAMNTAANTFAIESVMAGSGAVSLLPLASTTTVSIRSPWPHPQFQGAFLPATRTVTAEGFTAQWQVLELNRGFRQSWIDGQVDNGELDAAAFGVGLFQSVDVYQRSERAVKYALMFVALTFMAFYAWELLSAVAIHPMQYLLVGLALSTFYLLLIALTEHLPFWLAYWVGAAALVCLLGVYVAGALRSKIRGLAVAVLMSLVYGLLYLLVLSESYSLLMGAVALFVALATVMLATRHIQWYARSTPLSSPAGS
jgi:inner membrane protein